jgi:hypothetical protein
MKYTLTLANGRVLPFYLLSVAKMYQQIYGGQIG